jgi:putative acetyltransferase
VAVSVAIESPLRDDVRGLIRELNEVLNAASPPEVRFQMTPVEMSGPDTTVFIARENGIAIACGALRRHDSGVAEVKRMYTVPSHQGRDIGGRILNEIERMARAEGYKCLVLQTGDRMPAASRVYEHDGFACCQPVVGYPDSPHSVCYEKSIAGRSTVPA